MAEEIPKPEFVAPPEFTMNDLENLKIKLLGFGLGDKIHFDKNNIAVAEGYLYLAEGDGGWTQERKDKFMKVIGLIRARILQIELGKAKGLGL